MLDESGVSYTLGLDLCWVSLARNRAILTTYMSVQFCIKCKKTIQLELIYVLFVRNNAKTTTTATRQATTNELHYTIDGLQTTAYIAVILLIISK